MKPETFKHKMLTCILLDIECAYIYLYVCFHRPTTCLVYVHGIYSVLLYDVQLNKHCICIALIIQLSASVRCFI